MRRDYFTLRVRESDEEGRLPALEVGFEGPVEELTERLKTDGEPLEPRELDVGYRLRTALDAEDARGVLGVTNRVTGEYILELNAPAGELLEFVTAARGHDGDADSCYRLVLEADDGEELVSYRMNTLLVYDADGDLLRQHSLIPSGVEL